MGKLKMNREKKKKITSLILLLFVSVVMLSTATYAWFTSNKNVKIDTLNVHVETQSGLQISTNGTTWKTVINSNDIMTGYVGAVNQLPAVLEPVSTGKIIDTSTGFLEMYHGVATTNVGGDNILTATRDTETNSGDVEEGEDIPGRFIAFDIFLKVEKPSALYLTTSSSVIPKSETVDQGLKNASRVAFVVEGNEPISSAPAVIQALKAGTDSTTYIWEPNYDVHTDAGVANARDVYGQTTTLTGGSRLAYDGVIAGISESDNILLSNATAASFNQKFKTVTSDYTTNAAFGGSAQPFVPAFSLLEGVTKVRVYMWIEGQDVDCENNASGTDISFNVHFSVNES